MICDDNGLSDVRRKLNVHGVICHNCIVKNRSNRGAAVRSVTIGTIVQVYERIDKELLFSVVIDMKVEQEKFACSEKDIIPIPENLYAALFPVSPAVRLKLALDEKYAEALGNITPGVAVYILNNENKIIALADVTFRNAITALGPGVYFGVKIRDKVSDNYSEIAKLKNGHKNCPRDCDIVVTVDNIRPLVMNEDSHKERNTSYLSINVNNKTNDSYKTTFVLHMREKNNSTSDCNNKMTAKTNNIKTSDKKSEPCHLKIGDEVIYFTESNYEHGVVKWTGYIKNKFRVGVELRNPIGKSSTIDNIHYFESKPNHAVFVPIEDLMKYSDFCSINQDDSVKRNRLLKSNSHYSMDGSYRLDKNEDCIDARQRTKSSCDNNVKHDQQHKKHHSLSLDAGTSSFIRNVNACNNLHGPNGEYTHYTSHYNVPDASNHLDQDILLTDVDNTSFDLINSPRSDNYENDENYYDTPKPRCESPYDVPGDLGVGSLVEVQYNREPHYGVIRWIGTLQRDTDCHVQRYYAGVEMEDERNGFTDGTFNNKRYFHCNPRKAFFLPLDKCQQDSRFIDDKYKKNVSPKSNSFGQIECPVIKGIVPAINKKGDLEDICGKNKGIQGHHNSCYLDATLFAMFAFTSIFDSLLYRPRSNDDIAQYDEVQSVLKDEIVNPLRKNLYVRADRVMKLRTLMDMLSSVTGLTSEEKDPEEFINSLIAQILKAEPFLKLSSGQEAFYYQLFVEKDEKLSFPSVQQLFEQSFFTSDIKLKQVPSCLIIQMPRFGKSYKMYPKILPSQLLDITDIIENSPRQCTVCGKLAEFECRECFGHPGIGNGLESTSFCRTCLERVHSHHSRIRHNSRVLTVPAEFADLQAHCAIPRLYMELFAVVCIETSHYVSFVKCGHGSDAPWCFFDSMADRKGEQNGYNIPEMVSCPTLPFWLSEDGAKTLSETRQMPEHAKRLLCDAYMCMYRSPEVMMYR